MNVTGEGGKGSARRKGANDEAYAANYDRIFNKIKCPQCQSTDITSVWVEGNAAAPEHQWCECERCTMQWNECARDSE